MDGLFRKLLSSRFDVDDDDDDDDDDDYGRKKNTITADKSNKNNKKNNSNLLTHLVKTFALFRFLQFSCTVIIFESLCKFIHQARGLIRLLSNIMNLDVESTFRKMAAKVNENKSIFFEKHFVCLSELLQILLIPQHEEEEEGIRCKTERYLKRLHPSNRKEHKV